MKAIIKELRTDIQFFQVHAGWCTPPGKMACAFALAKAEADAQLLGYVWEWVPDAEGCIGCDCEDKRCKCSTGKPHEVLGCILKDNRGSVLGSLWGICQPDNDYRRVVEAELALEAFKP